MTLATVDASGQPSARIVLIRGYDERGFTFFTNYESRKGTDLLAEPRACLLFFWQPLERQVRIEGVGKGRGRGIRRLLPQPARRLADRRLGLAPEPAHHARRASRPASRNFAPATATSRRARRTGAATA